MVLGTIMVVKKNLVISLRSPLLRYLLIRNFYLSPHDTREAKIVIASICFKGQCHKMNNSFIGLINKISTFCIGTDGF